MGEELKTLDDVMQALKSEFKLVKLETFPEVYQKVNSTMPDFAYVPGKLDIAYQDDRIQVIDGLPNLKIHVFHPKRYLSARDYPHLNKVSINAARNNADIVTAALTPKDTFDFICEYIKFNDQAAA